MTMLRFNDELRERGATVARWRVADPIVRDGMVKLYDRTTRREEHESFDEINTKISANEIVLVQPSAPRIAVHVQGDPTLDSRIQSAADCLQKLQVIQRKRQCSFAAAYAAATGADGSPPEVPGPLPSRPTLYRYLKATKEDRPVFTGDKNKGNRAPRYSQEITNLIETAAETLYLVPGSTWDLGDLTQHINADAHGLGFLPPEKNISQEFVRNFVLHNLSVDPEIDRMDPKLRAAAKSIGAERIVVALPFDRVEQDALHLPIKINVNGQEANNVYLVHSIDCSLGMPTGWRLTVGNPSESDGLKCVESTLYSKRAAFERLGLVNDIDVDIFGTPRTLVLDNGPEARGQRMLRLARLGINVQYCKSRHAHHKPFIERLNRALKKALQRLRGSTRHNGKDGARDPVAAGERLMTLEELERWIVRWYYQKWAKTELKRHLWSDFHNLEKFGHTPELRLSSVAKRGYARRLSPSHSAWQMTLYEHDERMLNRKTGITYEGFEFKGPNLKYLLAKYGEAKVKILIDPEDYREIFVFDGEDMPLIPLREAHVTPGTPAHSFSYMKAHAAELAKGVQQDPIAAKFDRDMNHHAVEATLVQKTKRPSATERNRAAAKFNKEAAAVDRAAQRPLSAQPKVNPGDAEPTSYTFDDDVPELAALSRATGEVQK